MDERSRKLIARSISDNHLHWQHVLLENKYSTVKFRNFKESFLAATLDYTKLYEDLRKIELDLEIDNYLFDQIPYSTYAKYGLEWSQNSINEANEYISGT
jgi:hypothetical protein